MIANVAKRFEAFIVFARILAGLKINGKKMRQHEGFKKISKADSNVEYAQVAKLPSKPEILKRNLEFWERNFNF